MVDFDIFRTYDAYLFMCSVFLNVQKYVFASFLSMNYSFLNYCFIDLYEVFRIFNFQLEIHSLDVASHICCLRLDRNDSLCLD